MSSTPAGVVFASGAFSSRIFRPWRKGHIDIGTEDLPSERCELHFLAALVDDLMKALLAGGVMTRAELQRVEDAVSVRIGSPLRAW